VHTVAGGEREFALPERVEVVYDLYARQVVARDSARVAVTLPPRSTALYYTGRWELLAKLENVQAEDS
jgi:hypothetical protein